MTDTTVLAADGHGSPESTLRGRVAGFAAIQRCLEAQAGAKPLGPVARFFGASPLHPDARSWYRGATGEIEVGNALGRLGPEWTVLHSVPMGDADAVVDHLVIGPGGVFTISTQHHPGKKIWAAGGLLTINGQKTEHIRNALTEARRASDLLRVAAGAPVPVTPLIVVVGSATVVTGAKATSLTVLTVERLHRWLTKQNLVHSGKAVGYYSRLAEDRSTWHTGDAPTDDAARRVQRFQRLHREVDAARSRRRWALTVGALALGLVVVGLLVVFGPFSALFSALFSGLFSG